MLRKTMLVTALILNIICSYANPKNNFHQKNVDVCIYGATSAGIISAVAATRLGKKVIIIEPGKYIGGLTAGGLGFTDIGKKYAIKGLARKFYKDIGKYYGKREQWSFEPHVAQQVFLKYIKESHIEILYENHLTGVKKNSLNAISEIVTSAIQKLKKVNTVIRASVYIDASYEGDLMAMTGVSYTVGRESNSQYKENFDGFQLLDGHQFPNGVDPYNIPRNPASGLLWGVSNNKQVLAGSADSEIQAYNFRVCLTDNPNNKIDIKRQEDYDSGKYELLLRLMQAKPWKHIQDGFIWNIIPNHKTDINNKGGFSTDMIGMNYNYPNGNSIIRSKIFNDHLSYTKGLFYFLGHDIRVPLNIRNEMLQWGYPKDEYVDNDHFTPQLYIREARRMKGEYIVTQADCMRDTVVSDGIALASYTMDSHNCERIVVNGAVKNEGNVESQVLKPYPISYKSIVPRENECSNLIVPVCLSASHIAYGSIRMEPVFMELGEAAGVAAVLSINNHISVQKINILKLQKLLKFSIHPRMLMNICVLCAIFLVIFFLFFKKYRIRHNGRND